MSPSAKASGSPLRIVLDAYLVHYPLGGVVSWVLQYFGGFRDLGHDVYLVEKSPYPESCYDPRSDAMTDECSPALAWLRPLLEGHGLGDRWCYVDSAGKYHGMRRRRVEEVLRSADIFVELATHGHWLEEADRAACRVLIDGEPGFSHMKMESARAAGRLAPDYDYYFTPGLNIGTPRSPVPSAGREWRTMLPPIRIDAIHPTRPAADGRFTTVMNWQSHKTLLFRGVRYGQKADEFERFMHLPRRTRAPLEVAVSGQPVPVDRLERCGWRVRSANDVSASVDTYWGYIRRSRGEFSVAKNVFVATNSGIFSERSALYLANARPVVIQDTGFSEHLPCGRGLIAVRDVETAAEALDDVQADYASHSRSARELAVAHVDARRVLGRFLHQLGV
jgi:hypothetical protein